MELWDCYEAAEEMEELWSPYKGFSEGQSLYNHCSDGQVTADLNTNLIQKSRGKPSSIHTCDHSKSDLNFRGDNKQDILF